MADFRRNARSGGSREGSRFSRGDSDRGGSSSRGGFRTRSASDRGDRTGKSRADYQMHKVTCDKCGIECEVPFKPTSSKPVYCNDCYKKTDGPRNRDSRGSRDSGSRNDSSKADFDQINEKLNKIMAALKIE